MKDSNAKNSSFFYVKNSEAKELLFKWANIKKFFNFNFFVKK